MRALIVLSALVAFAAAVPAKSNLFPAFEAWKTKHGKTYETIVEEYTRFGIWEQTAKKVMDHNLRESLGLETYTTEMNKFADMSSEEFKATILTNWIPRSDERKANEKEFVGANPPTTQDWVSQGWVTGVKDQGQCGSCWSFSATGSLEGQHKNVTGDLISLSEQEQVSCNKRCYACNGGNVDLAFRYWLNTYQSTGESNYPYVSGSGNVPACAVTGKPVEAKLSGWTDVKSGSESALQSAVGLVGPVSVAIDASHWSFQTYSSGIYAPTDCSTTQLDHAVLTVGYNSNNQGKYWIVKNSWGTSWGQQGYIWMARDDNNMCGIATDASYPIGAAD